MHESISASEQSQAIDFSVLDDLRVLHATGEPDLVAEVVQLFLDDSPRRVSAIRAAAAAGDASQLGEAAHGLKGSAANVGAVQLRALCERLEHLGKSGDTSLSTLLVAALEAEYPRVQAALEPLVRGTKCA
jgi:HPt (histidine-containing phosphotransfer) domain-containing protein